MSSEADKTARLASALRANLARRKAQGRARQAAERARDDAPSVGQGEPVAAPDGDTAKAGAEGAVPSHRDGEG